MSALTHERLRDVVSYCPLTGEFRWLVSRGPVSAGGFAGWYTQHGYIELCIDYVTYRAHRLAWFYVYGEWPAGDIDHINRNRSDNRIANLRIATNSQNQANTVARTAGKLKGAYWHKRKSKWTSHICCEGKIRHLGYFDTESEAHAAYSLTAVELFGSFARTESPSITTGDPSGADAERKKEVA